MSEWIISKQSDFKFMQLLKSLNKFYFMLISLLHLVNLNAASDAEIKIFWLKLDWWVCLIACLNFYKIALFVLWQMSVNISRLAKIFEILVKRT